MEGRMTIDYRPEDLKGMQRELAAVASSEKSVVFRLDHLANLDVAAVRGLITLLRLARTTGTELTLRTGKPQFRRMLAVTALDRIFRVESPQEVAA
jgi:anti-anti-sigma regulatory factor